MSEEPAVLMVNLADSVLHRCGPVNLTTACGVRLDELTVGPAEAIRRLARSECQDCFSWKSEA